MKKRRRARAGGGYTIMEIMVVVIIISLVASAASVGAVTYLSRAKVKQAQCDVRSIAAASLGYLAHTNGSCPESVRELLESGDLRRGSSERDPWGGDFSIECSDGEPVVVSFGPDGEEGSDDDIRSDESVQQER